MFEKNSELKEITFAIVTISDRSFQGKREDLTGPELKRFLEAKGAKVIHMSIAPDEKEIIKARLMELCDGENSPEIILTAGGTGLGARDVTPEATREILEKEIPGIAEAMRARSMSITPAAMLSRAVSGLRKRTLIINLPGSPKGARENLEAVIPALPHAMEVIRKKINDCQQSKFK